MSPKLFHIFGPLYINSYGLCIAIGLLLVIWLAKKSLNQSKLLNNDQLMSMVMYGILGALIGGRFLYVLTNWNQFESFFEIFELWNGGASILGGIIGALAVIPLYAWKENLPTLHILDFAAYYAPLLQSISRLGCFFAGCCFGKPTESIFSIIYYHPDVVAPRFVSLHPTQLYSALALFIIFLAVRASKNIFSYPGQLTAFYLLLSSLERFSLDFLRGDQQFSTYTFLNLFSINQWVALVLIIGSTSFMFYTSLEARTNESF